MRWPYYDPNTGFFDQAAKDWWHNKKILVINPKNGKQVVLAAKDWGPAWWTGRVIDVSKTALDTLGVETDDIVNIEFADQNAPLGQVKGATFNINDIIRVYNTLDWGLKIHKDSPTGETLKVVPDGWAFKIIGGPKYNIDKHNWWKVKEEKYETSPVGGWVAQDYLIKVSSPKNLVPTSTPGYFVSNQDKIEGAIKWAMAPERKNENWKNLCLGFVAKAFGVEDIGWGCPQEGINNCPKGGVEKFKKEKKFYSVENCWNPPKGALIFFSGKGKDYESNIDYEKCGHIGIYLGNWTVVHAYGTVKIQNITGAKGIEREKYIGSYLGWAYPPKDWLSETFNEYDHDRDGIVRGDVDDLRMQYQAYQGFLSGKEYDHDKDGIIRGDIDDLRMQYYKYQGF
jgi:hypothetical protein